MCSNMHGQVVHEIMDLVLKRHANILLDRKVVIMRMTTHHVQNLRLIVSFHKLLGTNFFFIPFLEPYAPL